MLTICLLDYIEFLENFVVVLTICLLDYTILHIGVIVWFYPGSKSLVQDCGLFGVLVCACRLDAEEKLEALLMVAME